MFKKFERFDHVDATNQKRCTVKKNRAVFEHFERGGKKNSPREIAVDEGYQTIVIGYSYRETGEVEIE